MHLRLAFAVNTLIKNYPVEVTVCDHLFCFIHQVLFRKLIHRHTSKPGLGLGPEPEENPDSAKTRTRARTRV